jgi:serine/threonine protein kinase
MSAVEQREIKFLDHVNNVTSQTKELLLQMLTKDPKKRINWKELFEKELKDFSALDRNEGVK